MRRHGGGSTAAGEGAMDIMAVIFLVLGGLAAAALGARAAAAREGFLPAAVNALLGLAALLAVVVTTRYTGLHLGFNLFNGLTAGILGVPGVVLLLLVQWVIT